jgi:glycosyltransferase involved in cell wall biosynthesis
METVSIIIPAYNQGRFLAKAIETALHQTGAETEVVVVNDGSTDNTAEVAATFKGHGNFRYIEQANQGLPGARNRGIRESTGTYLCFLDADDFYHPDKVRKQVELLEADPRLAFVYCDVLCVDEAGNTLPGQWSVSEAQRVLSGNLFRSLMLGGYFTPHTVMIRKRVLDEVGMFDLELGGNADYELWLRVSGAGHRAYYLNERLAYYRMHGNNMTKDGLRMAETRVAAIRKIIERYPAAAA